MNPNKIQLFYTVGLPASGKTTWAKAWVEESPKDRVRINRDDIRKMLGPYWVPSREGLVTQIENNSINNALSHGYSVVVDATNFKFNRTFYEEVLSTILDLEIIKKDFTDVPVNECIKRDLLRQNTSEYVGADVIKRFAKKYLGYEEEN